MYATFATDYDLAVAADRLRDLQNEMKAVNVAQVTRPTSKSGQGPLDKLLAMAGRALHLQTPRGKVGAAV